MQNQKSASIRQRHKIRQQTKEREQKVLHMCIIYIYAVLRACCRVTNRESEREEEKEK